MRDGDRDQEIGSDSRVKSEVRPNRLVRFCIGHFSLAANGRKMRQFFAGPPILAGPAAKLCV
jgi:hypothetical protein